MFTPHWTLRLGSTRTWNKCLLCGLLTLCRLAGTRQIHVCMRRHELWQDVQKCCWEWVIQSILVSILNAAVVAGTSASKKSDPAKGLQPVFSLQFIVTMFVRKDSENWPLASKQASHWIYFSTHDRACVEILRVSLQILSFSSYKGNRFSYILSSSVNSMNGSVRSKKTMEICFCGNMGPLIFMHELHLKMM